ncbi:MAG: MFS transporter [Candidatus Rokuibacteriota bacterium]
MPHGVLAAAFLFNLGQGVLRPSLPLYLQRFFGANYRMVTLIPVAFGAGKWVASLPTGYLLDRLGRRRLMVTGLFVIAACDVASTVIPVYAAFLGVRGVAGVGWAMFGTVATTTMVDRPGGRGRAVSLLLMSETLGLLLGSVAGGWLYQRVAMASPFVFEAACMLVAAAVVGWSQAAPPERRPGAIAVTHDWRLLRRVVRTPGVLLMSLTSAALIGVQTGALVFLFPLYLAEQGRLRPETVGYLVGLGVLGRLVALWLAARVSDRWDRLPTLGLGLLGYGVLLGSLALVTDPLLLGVWSFMIGAGAGFVAGLPTAIIGDLVAPPLHGIAIGWLRTVTDTGMLLGPVVMGALADAVHVSAPFVAAAVLLGVLGWWCRRQTVVVSVAS